MVWSFVHKKPRWDPTGSHCYVTGGSAGLGLSVAILLARLGADVSIVARNEANLASALEALEAVRMSPNQILRSYSFALNTLEGARAAYDAACAAHGGKPADAVFLCAGASKPGFWVEADEDDIKQGMDMTYWVSAWTARVAAERMARARQPGKIVFVGSVLSYAGIIGYSTYCPGKHALRGLAETLRQELMLYGISVHMFFPASIRSPGFENETKTKPKITLKIEESDPIASPDECARGLWEGLQRGDFHITSTFNGEIFRTSTRGATPWNAFGRDLFYGLIGFIGLPLWRQDVDKMVRKHKTEHEEYLSSRGFFASLS
ncbi:oxidoreductase [Vararia minispora EC-137]|uniref:Oxidoreductase n=1 Tax=Vararia minispora EC-137 TaxID=1314806 RepID=A0ACB8QRZ7_9AGAM|nr:oxidoreductase [Vararia minispora EC-137]